jgi:hypothetical protein
MFPSGPTVNLIERDSLRLRITLTSYSPGFSLMACAPGLSAFALAIAPLRRQSIRVHTAPRGSCLVTVCVGRISMSLEQVPSERTSPAQFIVTTCPR